MAKRIKKDLAAYYTPSRVSEVLCELSISDKNTHILEPSFGGCSFLENSYNRLKQLGQTDPSSCIYGYDIDKLARKNLKGNFTNANHRNFKLVDFLKSQPDDFGKKFELILGNPPYLPISKMKNKNRAWEIANENKLIVSKKASLWVYFIVHSLNFLKAGGRLSFIIPESILFTNYGKQIQEFLCSRFGNVKLIKLSERIFLTEGTKEKTLFLLCEDFENKCERAQVFTFPTFNAFCSRIHELKSAPPEIVSSFKGDNASETLSTYELDDLCDIRIGIVTGASKHVIISHAIAKSLKLKRSFYYPVLVNGKYFKNINLTSNFFDIKEKERKFFLIDFEKLYKKDRNRYYKIKELIPQEVFENATFANRENWRKMDDNRIPQGIMVYHSINGPRIALNSAKVNVTNSIHRLFFKKKYNKTYFIKLVCISALTSFTQYHAELIGRSYGTGSLKLEPGDAKKLKILIPTFIDKQKINSVFKRIDDLLNKGENLMARSLADDLIFHHDSRLFDDCLRKNFSDEMVKIKSLRVA
ncbi:MAG TPA: N-6 DNA methylase [Chryseolinea sp.]|nr:N-6 DNA methylase [Chryseolinea sp.]